MRRHEDETRSRGSAAADVVRSERDETRSAGRGGDALVLKRRARETARESRVASKQDDASQRGVASARRDDDGCADGSADVQRSRRLVKLFQRALFAA